MSKGIQKARETKPQSLHEESDELNESDHKIAKRMIGGRSSTSSKEIPLKQNEEDPEVKNIPREPKRFLRKGQKSKIPQIK